MENENNSNSNSKLLFDTEEKRYIDRIRAVAFREARDAGAKFINKKWIAGRLNRSTEFVKHNWSKSYGECKTTFGGGRPQKLSEESVALVRELSKGSKRKSSVLIAKELETRTNEKISRTTVMRYQKKIISKDSSKVPKVKAPRKSRSKKKLTEPPPMTVNDNDNSNEELKVGVEDLKNNILIHPLQGESCGDGEVDIDVTDFHISQSFSQERSTMKIHINGNAFAEIHADQMPAHHLPSSFYSTELLNYSPETPSS